MHREGEIVRSDMKKSIRPLLALSMLGPPYLSAKSFLASVCGTVLSKVNGSAQGSVKVI